MNISDYIRRSLPNIGVGSYGDLLDNNSTINVENLSLDERENFNKLKTSDKIRLLNDQHIKETNYFVSPMIRNISNSENICGIRGTFQQVM